MKIIDFHIESKSKHPQTSSSRLAINKKNYDTASNQWEQEEMMDDVNDWKSQWNHPKPFKSYRSLSLSDHVIHCVVNHNGIHRRRPRRTQLLLQNCFLSQAGICQHACWQAPKLLRAWLWKSSNKRLCIFRFVFPVFYSITLTALVEPVQPVDVVLAHLCGLAEGHVVVRNGLHGGIVVLREGIPE